ncbi:MAG: sugar-binding domain-containing protein [Spirochaetales bacterium]|uniref:Sugar-binding domain-containing protein n=1 Tax=Candidatus Thalassospirochaeta sargassi TaxID=3119039 RepID=A0AAJ1IEE8_9SPIO|nr:sugar-binding domain-containing protein [Spirochaetales bacterium]
MQTDTEWERWAVLAEAAELYYLKGMQQAEIASKMNISRSLVSKMITEAQHKGIVTISINHFFRRAEDLESGLRDRYGIDAAVLRLPRGFGHDEIKKQLGRFSADIIYSRLEPGSFVGFTFGTSLKEAVDALALKPPLSIAAVQLAGSLGASEAAFDSHELVHKLSSSWNCGSVYLHAPYIVSSEEIRRQLFKSMSNNQNAEACKSLNAAVVGMSSFDSRSSSALYAGGHISAIDMKDMRARGIIGDIGSFSLDDDGKLIEVDSLTRMVAFDEKSWKSVKNRFGIAFGDSKIRIIKASLKGGWLTTFITDEQTADKII